MMLELFMSSNCSLGRRMRNTAAAVLGALALSCSDPAGVEIGGVVALSRAGRVELTNATALPVFAFVIGRELSTRALFSPCVDATQCPPIQPGARRSVPNPQGEREATVYWWHAVQGEDGKLQPDSIRVGVIRLKN